ncbi:MAG: M23 family metallopeptidase, partial [Acidimicrobiales bacterium]
LILSRQRTVIDPGLDGRVSGAGLVWPVRGTVTSPFGMRWGRLHAGIDISARTGVPIRAAKAGEVIFAGSMSGYGNCVIVNHGGGLTTLYAHQSRLATSEGANVGQGEVVGYVGSTGHSTGPHLHFETRVSGSPQNPRRFLP